jgi:hypothetical protein
VRVVHNVSLLGEEVGLAFDGPTVLDPMDGAWFGLSADGPTLQGACDELEAKLEAVREWCDACPSQPEG